MASECLTTTSLSVLSQSTAWVEKFGLPLAVEDGVFVKSLEFQTKDDAVEYITKKWRSRART